MVVVDYPDATCQKFFWHENVVFGPIDPNGDYRAVQVPLPFIKNERFEPVKGIFDENNVIHSSFEGKIVYYPILADCVPNPLPMYPRSLKVPVKEPPYLIESLYGFGCPEIGALAYISASQCIQFAIRRELPRTWTMIRVIGLKPTSMRAYVYRYEITFNRWLSPTTAEISQRFSYSVNDVAWIHGFSHPAKCQDIFDTVGMVTRWSNYSSTTKSVPGYTTDPSAVLSPDQLSSNLNTFVDDLMAGNFPLEERHYGELAMNAVKQRRTVDTNLFEFCRDIKLLKDAIPKLNNLKSVKGNANNYLGYKYGIMPTISDLKQIVKVFKSYRPFFDKLGNTIYNSSYKAETTTDSNVFTLEQYIKVAVANEDSKLEQLMDDLDNHGFGLTFENAWDLVRYSFVIDWFIDVGGFLERVDTNLRLIRLNIPYVTMSRKKTIYGEIPQDIGLPVVGPIYWRYYHRWVTSQCPLPPFTLSTTPTVSNHWLEAGALIIQRTH